MSMGGGSRPDFMGAAQQQADASRANTNAQTQANRPDQNTAWGSTSWSQDANGNWTQNQRLNGGLQGLMDEATQRQQQGIDYGQFGQLGNGDQARQQAYDASYGQSASRLDPQWNQRQDSLRNQLYNQGLREGDQGFDQQMANFGRERNDAYAGARNNAQMMAQSAGDSVFRNNLAAREQGIGEAQQQMNQPLQGFQGLLGASGSFSMPSFMGAGRAETPNYLGAAEAAANYGLQQQANRNAFAGGVMGGLGSLGAAAMPFAFGPAGGIGASLLGGALGGGGGGGGGLGGGLNLGNFASQLTNPLG